MKVFGIEILDGDSLSDEYLDERIEVIDELYQIHYPNFEGKLKLLKEQLIRLRDFYDICYIHEYIFQCVYSIGLKKRV